MKYIIAISRFINDCTRKDVVESNGVENNYLMASSVNNCKRSGPCFLMDCTFLRLHSTVDFFEMALDSTDSNEVAEKQAYSLPFKNINMHDETHWIACQLSRE